MPRRGDHVDIEAIVAASQRGDYSDMHLLVTHFSPLMRRVARRYLPCSHDADDAVQEAWMSFMVFASSIREPSSLAAWLCVTTSRAALATCRRQSKVVPSGFDLPPLADDDVESTVLPIAWRPVAAAVARLSAADRELLRLLFEEELPYSEISTRTGRAVGGIGPTRKRLLARLERDDAIRSVRRCA